MGFLCEWVDLVVFGVIGCLCVFVEVNYEFFVILGIYIGVWIISIVVIDLFGCMFDMVEILILCNVVGVVLILLVDSVD